MEFIKKNKKDIIFFTTSVLVIFLVYIRVFTTNVKFVHDDYNIEYLGLRDYAIKYNLKDGRTVFSLVNLLLSNLNVDIIVYKKFVLLISILILSYGIVMLKNIIMKYKEMYTIKQEIILFIICFATIFNFMVHDCLIFLESAVIVLSYILCIKAADVLVSKEKRYIPLTMLLLFIATECYQATICMFFAFTVFFTILKNKKIKDVLYDVLKMLVFAGIAILINYIIIKIVTSLLKLSQNRIEISISIIIDNIKKILKEAIFFIMNTGHICPLFMYVVFLVLTLIVCPIVINKKNSLKCITIIISFIICGFLLNVASSSSFYAARTKLSIGASIGAGILFAFIYLKEDRGLETLLLSVLLSFIFITLINCMVNNERRIKIYYIEQNDLNSMVKYVDQYENENKIKINKIVKVLNMNEYENGKNKFNEKEEIDSIFRSFEFIDRAFMKLKNEKYKIQRIEEPTEELLIKIHSDGNVYKCIDDKLFIVADLI